jgi:hypothetical protein
VARTFATANTLCNQAVDDLGDTVDMEDLGLAKRVFPTAKLLQEQIYE